MSLVCPTFAARGCHRGPSCTDALNTEHFQKAVWLVYPKKWRKSHHLNRRFLQLCSLKLIFRPKTERTSQPLIFSVFSGYVSFFEFAFSLVQQVSSAAPSPIPTCRPTTVGGWSLPLNSIVRRLFLVNIAFLINSFLINSLLIRTSRSNSHHGVN